MDNTTPNMTTLTLFDIPDTPLPVLPYGGTSGWSGSDTSKERAEQMDSTGTTKSNQSTTMQLLDRAKDVGLTWFELSEATGWHHGTASGALSVLHKAGQISRLKVRRKRSSVYVLNHYINDRDTEQHKPNVSARMLIDILTQLQDDLENDRCLLALAKVRATIKEIS